MAYIKTQPKKKYAKKVVKKVILRGTGDYKWVNDGPMTKTGATLGRSVGSFFGRPSLGKNIGRYLGNGVGNIFGTGDYHMPLNSQIKKNSIINPRNTSLPLISGVGSHGNSIIVRKREYIQDIVSSSSANTPMYNTFPLNPGQIKTFPFLSQLAQLYEQYIIRGMVFEFKSLSADAMSTTAVGLGFVAMATQYDVLDQPFNSKSQLENYEFSQSAKPSLSQMHGVECAKNQSSISELYTRVGTVPAGADARLYDFGTLTVLNSSPSTTSQVLGELWVEYDVEFIKSKLPQTASGSTESLHLARNTVNTTNVNFGVNQLYNVGSLINIINPSDLYVTLPNLTDLYKLDVIISTSSVFTVLPTLSLTVGTPINYISSSTTADSTSTISSPGAVVASYNFMYTVLAVPTLVNGVPTIQIHINNGTLSSSSIFSVDIFVNKLDSTISN